MPASKQFLGLCEDLHKLELLIPRFEVGERVGRGFADLGAEEFQIIGSNRIVSLFTGHTSELTADQRRFFFLIPDVDQLAAMLCERGFDIEQIERPDQRQWRIELRRVSDRRVSSVSAESLPEAFAQALLSLNLR